MSKHTQGPWSAQRFERAPEGGNAMIIGFRIMAETDQLGEVEIAEIYPKPTPVAVREENAALLAAAPDLLAACKLTLKLMDEGKLVRDISRDGSPGYAVEMLALVRDLQTIQSAILKAEGL